MEVAVALVLLRDPRLDFFSVLGFRFPALFRVAIAVSSRGRFNRHRAPCQAPVAPNALAEGLSIQPPNSR